MKNWLNKNYKILIILAFLIPIIIVAIVSISHVTVWYGISNPLSWAMYLSLGIEIAALSALAAISATMGRNVYFPFIIVTLIQFIGNIFFSYQYIDTNSKVFKDWVDLVTPLLLTFGVEAGDMVAHRRFLSVFSGGLLPLISLSFLHMLVKFSEDARLKKHNIINEENVKSEKNIEKQIDELQQNGIVPNIVTASDIIGEVSKVRLTEDDLNNLENFLFKPKNKSVDTNESIEKKDEILEENINEQDYDFDIEEIVGENENYKYNDVKPIVEQESLTTIAVDTQSENTENEEPITHQQDEIIVSEDEKKK